MGRHLHIRNKSRMFILKKHLKEKPQLRQKKKKEKEKVPIAANQRTPLGIAQRCSFLSQKEPSHLSKQGKRKRSACSQPTGAT